MSFSCSPSLAPSGCLCGLASDDPLLAATSIDLPNETLGLFVRQLAKAPASAVQLAVHLVDRDRVHECRFRFILPFASTHFDAYRLA
jgi:hypothetical protein